MRGQVKGKIRGQSRGTMILPWILTLGLIVVALGAAWGIRNQINGLIGSGPALMGAPTLWWYVDDSQVNARQWLDWGNRATTEPNEPYLKLCMRRARELWGTDFEIKPIIGRVAALKELGEDNKIPEGADRAPPALWMPWCRAAFLNRKGGLWMDGSVLPVGGGIRERILEKPVLAFGVDPDEGLSGVEGTGSPAAGRSAGWAMTPGHPVWAGLERDLSSLIAEGDQSWSAPTARRSLRWLWDKHCSGVITVDRTAEVSRDRYGRRLELDVLLGQSEWADGSRDGGCWVPLPDGRDGLDRASRWQWFTRLSEEQIRESEFVWARWATRV
jgi:hypothetical protein